MTGAPAALLDRRADLIRALADTQARLSEVEDAIAICEAEIPTLALPAPEPVRERHAVKDAVMGALDRAETFDPGSWSPLVDIAGETGVPKSSAHAFLLNARRKGLVQRDGNTDRWRLPQSAGEPVQQEAANG